MGRRFKPDFVLARNPAGVQAARALRAIGVFDTDDGKAAGLVFKLAAPFAHVITTPECISDDFGAKHLRYPGYKALAFLHPDEFQPDPEVRELLGVGDERFGIVRLTAMDSAHDRNQQGVPVSLARELIGRLERDMRVFVSSEGPLPDEWTHLGFPIAPRYMLDAMAAASIVVGDSGSMIAEAAMLGTPAVFLGSFAHKRTYLVDLETTWGLTPRVPPRRGRRHARDGRGDRRRPRDAADLAGAARADAGPYRRRVGVVLRPAHLVARTGCRGDAHRAAHVARLEDLTRIAPRELAQPDPRVTRRGPPARLRRGTRVVSAFPYTSAGTAPCR